MLDYVNTKTELTAKLMDMHMSQKQARNIADVMLSQEVDKIVADNIKLKSTFTPEEWTWLISNHYKLTITQDIQEYYKQMNTINKEMYVCICTLIEFENPYDKFMVDSLVRQLKCIIDCCAKFSKFDCPDEYLLNVCKLYYKKHNTPKEVGRPKEKHQINMIDVETGEVVERFDCRDAVIDAVGIKKSNLSQCLKSSKTNPNDTATWRKYKYNGRKYWFVEED